MLGTSHLQHFVGDLNHNHSESWPRHSNGELIIHWCAAVKLQMEAGGVSSLSLSLLSPLPPPPHGGGDVFPWESSKVIFLIWRFACPQKQPSSSDICWRDRAVSPGLTRGAEPSVDPSRTQKQVKLRLSISAANTPLYLPPLPGPEITHYNPVSLLPAFSRTAQFNWTDNKLIQEWWKDSCVWTWSPPLLNRSHPEAVCPGSGFGFTGDTAKIFYPDIPTTIYITL